MRRWQSEAVGRRFRITVPASGLAKRCGPLEAPALSAGAENSGRKQACWGLSDRILALGDLGSHPRRELLIPPPIRGAFVLWQRARTAMVWSAVKKQIPISARRRRRIWRGEHYVLRLIFRKRAQCSNAPSHEPNRFSPGPRPSRAQRPDEARCLMSSNTTPLKRPLRAGRPRSALIRAASDW